MRRIIERVVTVVTTTTWTISLQADTPQPDPEAGPGTEDFSNAESSTETVRHIQRFSSVVPKKEADPAEMKTETELAADEPQTKSQSSKIERK